MKKIDYKARSFYKRIKSVYCPYFGEKVAFTSKGFNHIKYRKKRKTRHPKVREMRYRLLAFAPKIITLSNTLQEYEQKSVIVRVRKKNGWLEISKKVRFFGFIAIIDGWKVKVVIRQVGNSKKHFWSIIPNWRTRKIADGKKVIQNYTGNLSED